MSSRSSTEETRTIHPHALAELGEEACIVVLGVARDLRSGVIPTEKFDMRCIGPRECCGSSCCIAGWMRSRGVRFVILCRARTGDLFAVYDPSDPILAADAIERYVYDGSETPWSVT